MKYQMNPAVNISNETTAQDNNNAASYRSSVGSQLYLTIIVCPDVGNAVSALGSHGTEPTRDK